MTDCLDAMLARVRQWLAAPPAGPIADTFSLRRRRAPTPSCSASCCHSGTRKTRRTPVTPELYTLYLTVNPDTLAVGPFLQVVGGDLTVAEVAGSQTLVARGETNMSGEVTLRWGVQDIGAAPTVDSSDDLDYANQAAGEADGWTVMDTATAGAFTFDTGHAIPGSGIGTSIRFHAGDGSGILRMEKTFAVASGQVYEAKIWAEPAGAPWWQPGDITATSGANVASDHINGNEPAQQLTAQVMASSPSLTARLEVGPHFSGQGFYFAGLTIEGVGGGAEVDFRPVAGAVGFGAGV